MKTLLCCIARKENRYLREYVEYYERLGFSHICIYDNNYEGEERIEDAIGDYVESGFVDIVDYRGRQVCQIQAYDECYKRHGGEYDWIAFFDCDEFLTFAEGGPAGLEEALSWSGYDGYDAVCVNWMLFTDGGMIEDDGRPVVERFTEPVKFRFEGNKGIMCLNDVLKAIVRGGLEDVRFLTPHSFNSELKTCNNVGEPTDHKHGRYPYNYDRMYLRHYQCKTISEFLWKVGRGYPDQPNVTDEYNVRIRSLFFGQNKVTREKLLYVRDKTGIDLSKYYPKHLRI